MKTNKKKALLTGGSGFIGRNIRTILQDNYDLYVPGRKELNLIDEDQVNSYLTQNNINVVFHCANPNPAKNPVDQQNLMAEDSIRVFLNLYKNNQSYEKLIFLGSGAQYDKTQDIVNVTEEEVTRSIPKDAYGFAKYVINEIASRSENIYNLCVFGCYGPGDADSKFITHCIRCCLDNRPITIRQNCKFDYIHVLDLGRVLSWMGYSNLQYHMYNASGCQHKTLLEIAEEVKRQMKSPEDIIIMQPGWNKEYTCNGMRLCKEAGFSPLIDLTEGIKQQIEWEQKNYEKKSCGYNI